MGISYAIIDVQGKNEKVFAPGEKLFVNHINNFDTKSKTVKLPVLFYTDGENSFVDKLDNVFVNAKVLGSAKSKKIKIVKFKNKTRYHKHTGHRQELSVLEITDIPGYKKPKIEPKKKQSTNTKKSTKSKATDKKENTNKKKNDVKKSAVSRKTKEKTSTNKVSAKKDSTKTTKNKTNINKESK
jgi:large subunit ribosomal protein L21